MLKKLINKIVPWNVYWDDGYANYEGKIIKDTEVANLVMKHLNFFDKLNPRKVAIAGIYAQLMLFGVVATPTCKKWRFFDKHFEEAFGKIDASVDDYKNYYGKESS